MKRFRAWSFSHQLHKSLKVVCQKKMLSPVTLSTVILILCKKGERGSQTTTRINAAFVWQEHGLTLLWQTHSSYRPIILVSLQIKWLFVFYL